MIIFYDPLSQGEPQRMASAIVGDYYTNGDRGYQDEDGYIYFVGRSDDVITSAG